MRFGRSRSAFSGLLAVWLVGCAASGGPSGGLPADAPSDVHVPFNGPSDSAPAVVSGPVNLSGFSPEFRQGYADGCDSAGATRAQKRSGRRYLKDAQYQQGWDDGYSVCRR